ncbi:hypothetical protein [Arenibacter sp. ARW7G5Y1]|uniref:hypothetical protein n=1 Tax=Arenibacter sp. ARW7G5Y1 TaxID=2135619 RepID=UPI000D7523C7|nr:hypothetical protein [Arenibacter sp. ARW7G5Y1]PXX31570.1 hypothetical protein C7972_101408 [Arenibacter sp. ARW7G5Y1]
MKYSYIALVLLMMLGPTCFSQTKLEREHRIKKSQFPSINKDNLPMESARYIRYYREVDSSKITYILKFRIKKMNYHIDFNEKGAIQNTGFTVKEVDIPTDTYAHIDSYLRENFKNIRIKYIQQRYPGTSKNILKNTFQNLILPSNTYRLMFRGKKVDKKEDFIAIFDAEGNLTNIAVALPANYDRVLY